MIKILYVSGIFREWGWELIKFFNNKTINNYKSLKLAMSAEPEENELIEDSS